MSGDTPVTQRQLRNGCIAAVVAMVVIGLIFAGLSILADAINTAWSH